VNDERFQHLAAVLHGAAGDPEYASKLHAHLRDSPLMRLVGLAGQSVGHSFRRVFADEDGLSPGSAAVLSALAFGTGRGIDPAGTPGRATHSELAKRCLITPATLTGIVSTLEKAGYVRRERDRADRRVVWLLLTETGEERAKEIGARFSAVNEALTRDIDPALEQSLRSFLITVIENNFAIVQEIPPVSDNDVNTVDEQVDEKIATDPADRGKPLC
jgi:MarR family transcriptional regulator, organic hydroperoxide resistance regulator